MITILLILYLINSDYYRIISSAINFLFLHKNFVSFPCIFILNNERLIENCFEWEIYPYGQG